MKVLQNNITLIRDEVLAIYKHLLLDHTKTTNDTTFVTGNVTNDTNTVVGNVTNDTFAVV